ncbi:hypothetical protein [Aquabacterium olei]|nr:hypothetical protein [Aquabacterium olei]
MTMTKMPDTLISLVCDGVRRPAIAALLALTCLGAMSPAWAHGGEDHGDEAATPAALPGVLPRAATHTDEVELVAVLEPGRLRVYLDQAATNAPLAGARVEVEGLGATAVAAESEPGVYDLKLAQAPKPGHHPLTVSVQAGDTEDLLTAELDVPEVPAAADHDHSDHDHPEAASAWTTALWVLAGAVFGALAATALRALNRRRQPASPNANTGS